MSPAASSRWCPTPEQLMILEEMYRGGVRTPSASQIQQITAHLSFYGKIEGKNVFYWFQNHKARDRQKLRRKLSKQLHQQELYQQQQQNHHYCHHHHHLLHYFDNQFSSSHPPPPPPPAPPALPQLSLYSPVGFLPQGGVEDASTPTMSYSWNKVDHFPERFEMDKSVAGSNGRDWMIMLDVGSTTPCCNKPLKTLELFPITATGLKQESPTPEHIPSTN